MNARFEASALTHMLVCRDPLASRDWYVRCLDASVYGTYDTSVVLDLLGNWLLLVEPGAPDEGKPTVTLDVPADPDRMSAQFIFRVQDCLATHALLAGRGVEFLAAPHARGSETRAFFRDLDGHLFEISSIEGGEATG